MKKKYGWTHISDYVSPKTPYGGATQSEFEKKHTVPDQAVDVKKLVNRIKDGRVKKPS
jgi:hypothetical protein